MYAALIAHVAIKQTAKKVVRIKVEIILLHRYVVRFIGLAKINTRSIGSALDSPIIDECNDKIPNNIKL
jgi:hypothetical protein